MWAPSDFKLFELCLRLLPSDVKLVNEISGHLVADFA